MRNSFDIEEKIDKMKKDILVNIVTGVICTFVVAILFLIAYQKGNKDFMQNCMIAILACWFLIYLRNKINRAKIEELEEELGDNDEQY